MRPGAHMLPDSYPVTAGKVIPEAAPRIKDAVTADQRVSADLQNRVFIMLITVIAVERLTQHAIIADGRIVPDLYIVVNDGIITDPDVRPDFGFRGDYYIPIIKFHIVCFYV
jgi:hypothetical protein